MPELPGEALRRWRQHPAQFVREVLGATPDAWQDDVLEAFPHRSRIALKSCKGPGKTSLEAWLCWNFLLTRPDPKIAATSITADNLSDNLWTEMAKWQARSPLLQSAFEWRKTRIVARQSPETWWMSARTWPRSGTADEQANTLAGLHADYIMFVLDESGGMPDSVMVAAEAALSSCVEGHILQAGNPTHREGPLYRACTTGRELWHVVEISADPDDPKRTPRVGVQWAKDQIALYGRDNPWVLVNIFGQFPPSSLNTLLGPDDITAAQRRSYSERDIRDSARVLGVDVARFGDDASVIFPRQGVVAFAPAQLRNVSAVEGAGAVARKWADWKADAVFIDDTGGYGAGWIDCLTQLGRRATGVAFSGSPSEPRYANKRSEMYFAAAEWIRQGGQLPGSDVAGMGEFTAAMTRTTYSFRGDRLLLEPKEMVKARIGRSPDFADAFALTFAHPVAPSVRGNAAHRAEYDPFERVMRAPASALDTYSVWGHT